MNWISIEYHSHLEDIKEKSFTRFQLIFKHSTRCSISRMAKSRLERANAPKNIDYYFMDLIKFRELSNKIATEFHVNHESPQVLLIKNGECIYAESHNGIAMEEIEIFTQQVN